MLLNLLDYVMPDAGFYGLLYNYLYTSDQLNNPQGNKIDSVVVNVPGKPLTRGFPPANAVELRVRSPAFRRLEASKEPAKAGTTNDLLSLQSLF